MEARIGTGYVSKPCSTLVKWRAQTAIIPIDKITHQPTFPLPLPKFLPSECPPPPPKAP